jgi:hypothetical protein
LAGRWLATTKLMSAKIAGEGVREAQPAKVTPFAGGNES